MAKLQLTYNFETTEALIAHLQSVTGKSAAAVPVTTLVAPIATPTPEVTAELITADVDKDGLPWSGDYHADPKSFNDDGTWRSKRGKADEAKKARAAFLAKGGVVPLPAAMPTMPTMMPTMPVAAPILPPPVSYEKLVNKITGMMQRGICDGPAVMAMYGEAGFPDPTVYETNETARSALYKVLLTREAD